MAIKAILKDQDGIEILPITRAELILDSEGNPAFRSASLLATDADPGLMSQDEKKLLRNAVVILNTSDGVTTLTDVNNTPIYPLTAATAVTINNTDLDTYLKDKLTLDERPTKDSVNGVQSGGVYAEIENVVGAIYTNLKEI